MGEEKGQANVTPLLSRNVVLSTNHIPYQCVESCFNTYCVSIQKQCVHIFTYHFSGVSCQTALPSDQGCLGVGIAAVRKCQFRAK
jgi:hypothetical protein